MSVWSRIRWINVGRAVVGLAALSVVIAWPRLGAPPPAVPDGMPVPVSATQSLPAARDSPAGDAIPAGEADRDTGTDSADKPTSKAPRFAARDAERADPDGRRPRRAERRDKAALRRRGVSPSRSRQERRATTRSRTSQGARGERTRRPRVPVTSAPSPTPSADPVSVAPVVAGPKQTTASTAQPPALGEFGFER